MTDSERTDPMTTDSVTLFLALLAVTAQATVTVGVFLALGRRVSSRLATAAHRVAGTVGPQALSLAAGVAAVSMAGSLYLSEGAHFPPCVLCWYQRIAMYPLVPVLALAARRHDHDVKVYALPLAVIGALISAYHVLVERYPSLETGACDPTNPCSIVWVRRFGYLTIPTMALSAFALIATLLLVARPPSDLDLSDAHKER